MATLRKAFELVDLMARTLSVPSERDMFGRQAKKYITELKDRLKVSRTETKIKQADDVFKIQALELLSEINPTDKEIAYYIEILSEKKDRDTDKELSILAEYLNRDFEYQE